MDLLSTRATDLREIMDRADCDTEQLTRTYRQFGLVNTAVAGWSLLYRHFIRPTLLGSGEKRLRVLDIGCGGGDVLHRLALRCQRDGLSLEAVGIDPDERAIRFARDAATLPHITFRVGEAQDLIEQGECFTVVLSNHVLHHLTEEEIPGFLRMSQRLATHLVLHNDIHRHPLAYAGFPFIGGLFSNSFILADGLRSIRRSFTPAELKRIAPPDWEVHTALPFRCVLLHRS